MEILSIFFVGIGIGLIMTAPVGAVNVMCFHRALHKGFLAGVSAGFGAVVADAFFAALAVFGVTALLGIIKDYSGAIELVGGLLLLAFGYHLWRTPPPVDGQIGDGPASLFGGFITAFLMTITNPGAVLGFATIFTYLGTNAPSLVPAEGSYFDATIMVAGVALGSIAWWASLSGVVSLFRRSIDEHWLDKANLVAGAALILFGSFILLRLVYSLF